MVNNFFRINSICVLLFSLLLFAAGFPTAVDAARLKDVRIGEYEDYTRIVFEFDTPTAAREYIPQTPGRLSIVFNDTTANLVRKIPVKSRRHLNSLQLWQKKGNLSVLFFLNADVFHHKSFQLAGPPRFAVDIFNSVSEPAPSSRSSTAAVQRQNDPGDVPATLGQPLESNLSDDRPLTASGHKIVPPRYRPQGAPGDEPLSADMAGEPTGSIQPPQVNAMPPEPGNRPPATTTAPLPVDPSHQSGPQRPSRLQFYLVLGLVAITIVILVILLLMLFSKRHWAGEKRPIKVRESLKSQDEHIAALNARIKEQFKRYEEA